MTCIQKRAIAGTLESSDAYVELTPRDGGLEIEIESVVYRQFGQQIRDTVESVLSEFQVENARVFVHDCGALDCVLRARLETAIRRGGNA